ncbi:MAG: DUF1800 domain-containing protein [Blastocatellales bacterium]
MNRRDVIKSTAAIAGVAGLTGCERIISRLSDELGQSIPDRVTVTANASIDADFHLLSRATYGIWPGDQDELRRSGREAWIERQLEPESIDDRLCDLRARRFETIWHEPGTCYEYKKPVLREEITRHTLLRAVYSRRQLFEVMVGFWTDHLNINLDKGDCIYLKPADDRLVIRAHALGRFRDLIRASATSPAMLVYLDGKENIKSRPEDIPNENYARELMELHTLGVDGGYTQQDVFEAARCLTGWRLRTKWRKGTVWFDPAMHDDGEKRVLGSVIPAGGGEKDLDRLVDIVCGHPSTARHISFKLTRRFIADDPPESIVDRLSKVFRSGGGEIRPVLRELFASPEFEAARGAKLKRPFHYIASCLRFLGADTHAHPPLIEFLQRMGQAPFGHPTPDGYPDDARPWLGTLLWRWNFALALAAGHAPSVDVQLDRLVTAIGGDERLFPWLTGRQMTAEEAEALGHLSGKDGRATLAGLILASPAFQRC